MPDDPNPFQPWRPHSAKDDSPGRIPDDDLLRPWRSGRQEPDEDDPEWYRQPRAAEPAWTPNIEKPRGGGTGFIWLTVLLFFAVGIVWAANGGSHITRVAAASLAVWVGLLLAMVVGRQRRWSGYGRWGALATGLVVMVLCWMFVPTRGGVSLWTADRVLSDLRDLSPGDTTGFAALAAERQAVAREFPRYRNDLRLAEFRWYDRTINQELSQLNSTDPAATLTRLRRVRTVLPPGDFQTQQLLQRLQQARQRVFTQVLEKADRECEELIRQKQYASVAAHLRQLRDESLPEARELNVVGDLDSRIRDLRERSFGQHLSEARLTLGNLLRQEQYVAVAEVGRRLTAELLPEAQVLGQVPQVKERLGAIRKQALNARIEEASETLADLVKSGKVDQVPERVRRAEAELAAENVELDSPVSLITAFTPAREAALMHRADRARKILEELLGKKEYVAVASRAEELVKDLETEGAAIGRSGWREGIVEVRRKALQARFDVVRTQAQEQLKERRYKAMAETAEKAYTEFATEAEAVGLRGELVKFRDLCRFYARLAQDAGEGS